MRTPQHEQPKVSADFDLLKAAHLHDGLALDLYGTFDEDGYKVYDVALAGTNIALHDIVTVDFLESLSIWCFWNLPSAEELNREAANEALIDSAIFHSEIFGRRRYP